MVVVVIVISPKCGIGTMYEHVRVCISLILHNLTIIAVCFLCHTRHAGYMGYSELWTANSAATVVSCGSFFRHRTKLSGGYLQ